MVTESEDSIIVNVNSKQGLAAAFLIGVIGPEVFIVQPGFVQGLVVYMNYSEQAAGYVAALEMFGVAATTVSLTFFAGMVNWRKALSAALLLMFAANAACALTTDPLHWQVLRFTAGLGAGVLVSLGFAIVGLTAKPDRNFGLLIMWVLIYGALVLWLMPGAYDLGGMNAVLWFFALFPLSALPFIRFLPEGGEVQSHVEQDAIDLNVQDRSLALGAMFAYFLAQGVVWAYLFLIGVAGGLSEQEVATGLMLSQLAGIAGAALAAILGRRFGRSIPLSLGILGGAACLYFLTGQFAFLLFAVVVSIYNFAWNLSHPYLLAAMASFDRKGNVVVYAVAMQMLGLAFGPAVAAYFLADGDLGHVNQIAAVLFVLSWLLVLPPVIKQARQASIGQFQETKR